MKKLFILNLLFALVIALFCSTYNLNISYADETLILNTSYYVLMEPKSKKVLLSNNENAKLYPASMTKMMGMLIILEEINKGNISFDDEVTCSSYAASMGGTQIFLAENETLKLIDLFKAVAINSANDAITCLSEYVSGSVDAFVKRMNEKAKELNMQNTHFNNPTGFDDEEHYTSPLDMALLGSELLKYEDQVLPFSSLKEAYIREDTENPFWLVNTNKLLNYYDGMDGLKTGYTAMAGYNLTATAIRKDVRLISVVMHEESIAKRSQDTIRLLDYGFNNYKNEKIYSNGDVITKIKISALKEEEINIIVKEDVNIVLRKNETRNDLKITYEIFNNQTPIDENEIIGKLTISSLSATYNFNLYPDRSIKKSNFLDILLNNLINLFI